MKIKTSELTPIQLDYLVGIAQGWTRSINKMRSYGRISISPAPVGFWDEYGAESFHPSTDWSQGGPIQDKEDISVWISDSPELGKWAAAGVEWMSLDIESEEFEKYPDPYHGSTPLIAICRCYVASKLGDEVEVPDELCACIGKS